MKTTRRGLLSVALFLELVVPTSSIAQQDERDVDRKRDQQLRDAGTSESTARDDQADVDDTGSRQPGAADHRPESRIRRQVVQLTKLQTAMKKELDLSHNQEEAINQIFKDHLRALKETKSRQRPFGVKPEDANELRQLREKMVKAHKNGDQENLEKLREEFREKMQSRSTTGAVTISQFLKRVEAELNEEQRPKFRNLTRRLRIGSAARTRSGELRALWRTVMRPDISLSDEQRQTIHGILRDGFVAIGEVESDSDEAKEITARVQADIFEKLTAEQRAKVEAALESEKNRPGRRRGEAARRGQRQGEISPAEDTAGDQEEKEEDAERPDDDQEPDDDPD